MTADEIAMLADVIRDRTGLNFRREDELAVLAAKLERRVLSTGCGSWAAYCNLLRADGADTDRELLAVITELSRKKSKFVRHGEMARIVTEELLPEIVRRTPDKALSVWSAGCSSGEEPLMIAMALDRAGWFDRARVAIHASDGDATAVERAQRAIYDRNNVAYGLTPDLRETYFTAVDHGWQAANELCARISYSCVNLMDEGGISPLAAADIIVCQNVLIYFSDNSIVDALSRFAKYMPAGGFFIGDQGDHFERLALVGGQFEQQKRGDLTVWKKAAA